MTQTLALFIDAYRLLNARKIFWITLVLSLLVVSSFALVGIHDGGISIAWSQATACGSILVAPKSRAMSKMACCSSVIEKSYIGLVS